MNNLLPFKDILNSNQYSLWIGQTIEDVAEEKGFTVVPCFTGHGIGHQIHAAPDIYHIGDYPHK